MSLVEFYKAVVPASKFGDVDIDLHDDEKVLAVLETQPTDDRHVIEFRATVGWSAEYGGAAGVNVIFRIRRINHHGHKHHGHKYGHKYGHHLGQELFRTKDGTGGYGGGYVSDVTTSFVFATDTSSRGHKYVLTAEVLQAGGGHGGGYGGGDTVTPTYAPAPSPNVDVTVRGPIVFAATIYNRPNS